MQGIILAAGIGSRLRPLTLHKPKACVTVDGTPILARQLRAYADAGVNDVTVVAGYLADDVRDVCREVAAERPALDVTVRESEVYANTDNMYSLSLVADRVAGEPFVLTNGDVAFDPGLLSDLVDADADSGVACDRATFSEEAMKVTVDDGAISGIRKPVPESDAHGLATDAYRFSAAFSDRLFAEIDRTIERDGNYCDWTEAAMDRIVVDSNHDLEPVDVTGRTWVEVDDLADLREADRRFSSLSSLGRKTAAFFDLDGTLYLDDELVAGAKTVVESLRESGVEVYFLSNNSSGWKDAYADRLSDLGISAVPDDVLLSTDGVIEHLQATDVGPVYVLGTEAMREAIADHGVEVVDPAFDTDGSAGTDADDLPEVVVAGFDTELTYEKARRATLAIRHGATFLLAHPDDVCPTAAGFVPDAGSIAALVRTATDRQPSRVFGKPNPGMLAPVLDAEGCDPAEVVVVGDRLETDVALADAVGCESVCVLTGDATRAAVEQSDHQPTLVAQSVETLTGFVDATPGDSTVEDADRGVASTDGGGD